jgi:flagellar basal body rod protein FlgF
MKIKLIEELQRNKELMGLNEETSPIHISVSKDGTVNFWDLKTKKVYRYKLVAVVGGKKSIDIEVKSIDLTEGTITYLDPNANEEATDKINDDAKENIINNYMNKEDINNLAETKARGFKVIINLVFVGEEPLKIN